MKSGLIILSLILGLTGCTTRTTARLEAQNAYLSGQNAVLRQQQAQGAGVTIKGSVQIQQVAWVAGLTLAQAVATANYLGEKAPKEIILTRQGESATLDAKILLNGPEISLEIGDVIELR